MSELSTRLAADYGPEIASRILAGSCKRPVTFRVNTLKASADEVFVALSKYPLERVSWYQDAFIVRDVAESELEQLLVYRDGKIYLQSLSSMIPPLVLAPHPMEDILDMTAAPGGKTCELYALSGGNALITACERDKIRYDRLIFNLTRQGATRITAIWRDALKLDDFFSFDKILLDAPCTGSGTITPDEPGRYSEAYLQKCVQMQEKLLQKALKLLRRGGTLVYSTCSVLKAENEELLGRVLPRERARLVPFEIGDIPRLPSAPGTLLIPPTELYEGFFVAKITK